MIRDDFQMDPPPPPPPPEGNLNNCQMPRATAAGRYHVLSWLASSQASFVVRASPNSVLLPFVRPRVSPLPFQNQFVFRSHVPCRSPFPSIWLVNVVCIYFAEPGENRTPGFPGTGANLRLRERAKGALLPSLRISKKREEKEAFDENLSISRENLLRYLDDLDERKPELEESFEFSKGSCLEVNSKTVTPTFLMMDLSFVPLLALPPLLTGNRSISQIAPPLFLVERSFVKQAFTLDT